MRLTISTQPNPVRLGRRCISCGRRVPWDAKRDQGFDAICARCRADGSMRDRKWAVAGGVVHVG